MKKIYDRFWFSMLFPFIWPICVAIIGYIIFFLLWIIDTNLSVSLQSKIIMSQVLSDYFYGFFILYWLFIIIIWLFKPGKLSLIVSAISGIIISPPTAIVFFVYYQLIVMVIKYIVNY